jgi:hypothetical protein
MARAPAMSRGSESPTKMASEGQASSGASAASKIRASGFRKPTAAESIATDKQSDPRLVEDGLKVAVKVGHDAQTISAGQPFQKNGARGEPFSGVGQKARCDLFGEWLVGRMPDSLDEPTRDAPHGFGERCFGRDSADDRVVGVVEGPVEGRGEDFSGLVFPDSKESGLPGIPSESSVPPKSKSRTDASERPRVHEPESSAASLGDLSAGV